jgi:hypothetical protein
MKLTEYLKKGYGRTNAMGNHSRDRKNNNPIGINQHTKKRGWRMVTKMEMWSKGKGGKKGSHAAREANLRYKAQQRGELPETELYELDMALELAGL